MGDELEEILEETNKVLESIAGHLEDIRVSLDNQNRNLTEIVGLLKRR